MNIKIDDLKKYYYDKLILNINEVEFKENYTYCIKGRNGSGKTTIMQIIANLLPYDEGEILYDNELIHNEIMKDMTYVSQNPYIFNGSVYDNVYYPLKIRNYDKNYLENEINSYLEYFEIEHIKDQNAKKCSSGEKMKIAIARSLIFKPKLLLLDEPTTNLDIESIEKLKEKLLEIKKHTTIIFISHHLNFINAISDVQFILKDTILEMGEECV